MLPICQSANQAQSEEVFSLQSSHDIPKINFETKRLKKQCNRFSFRVAVPVLRKQMVMREVGEIGEQVTDAIKGIPKPLPPPPVLMAPQA